MTTSRFCRFDLRTTDVPAAREFYRALLGTAFWDANVSATSLPAQAAARGAPAHWLGQIGVRDFAEASSRIIRAGGERLGPAHRAASGAERALFRDPAGAVFGLDSEARAGDSSAVTWHLHHSTDEADAFTWYRSQFGWFAREAFDFGIRGKYQIFASAEGEGSAGGFVDGVRSLHAHPQWLFFFMVADLTAAVEHVRALGGLALDPVEAPNGDQMVACDDAQGAAFGLSQRR